eukprot:scaffold1123_cov213-Alexandrium_tamarense.AAC.4
MSVSKEKAISNTTKTNPFVRDQSLRYMSSRSTLSPTLPCDDVYAKPAAAIKLHHRSHLIRLLRER